MLRTLATTAVSICCCLLIGACASYAVPRGRADFRALGIDPAARERQTDVTIKEVLARKPLAEFPTGVAMVRIQAPGYQSQTAQGYGHGAYSVIITRDIEK